MAIKLVDDVLAPVAVVAVDLITETAAPTWNEWASYILAAGGYAGAMMGWGGDMVKNIGIASLPWAAKKIYNRIKTPAATTSRVNFRPTVSRYPAPATDTNYEGVKLI
jgi:hypothetical protein